MNKPCGYFLVFAFSLLALVGIIGVVFSVTNRQYLSIIPTAALLVVSFSALRSVVIKLVEIE